MAGSIVACNEPREAPRVEVTVVSDSSGLRPVTTSLGYEVRVTEADVFIRDLEFAIAGEAHASLWQQVSDSLVPQAFAHPGHYQGGDVTGELPGNFRLHFEGDHKATLGNATLLVGDYESANFYFARADDQGAGGAEDGSEVAGHTALLRGVAARDGKEVAFSFLLDSPEARQLVGAPFVHKVQEGGKLTLGLRLTIQDPLEGDTLFDDIDFLALNLDAVSVLEIGPTETDEALITAYNLLLRKFQTHDHFDVQAQTNENESEE